MMPGWLQTADVGTPRPPRRAHKAPSTPHGRRARSWRRVLQSPAQGRLSAGPSGNVSEEQGLHPSGFTPETEARATGSHSTLPTSTRLAPRGPPAAPGCLSMSKKTTKQELHEPPPAPPSRPGPSSPRLTVSARTRPPGFALTRVSFLWGRGW